MPTMSTSDDIPGCRRTTTCACEPRRTSVRSSARGHRFVHDLPKIPRARVSRRGGPPKGRHLRCTRLPRNMPFHSCRSCPGLTSGPRNSRRSRSAWAGNRTAPARRLACRRKLDRKSRSGPFVLDRSTLFVAHLAGRTVKNAGPSDAGGANRTCCSATPAICDARLDVDASAIEVRQASGHAQLPALQCAPPQATPQVPQFKSSAFRSTHDWLPQIERPHGQQFEVGQPYNTQAPATQ